MQRHMSYTVFLVLGLVLALGSVCPSFGQTQDVYVVNMVPDLSTYVDQVESYIDGVETLIGRVTNLEAQIYERMAAMYTQQLSNNIHNVRLTNLLGEVISAVGAGASAVTSSAALLGGLQYAQLTNVNANLGQVYESVTEGKTATIGIRDDLGYEGASPDRSLYDDMGHLIVNMGNIEELIGGTIYNEISGMATQFSEGSFTVQVGGLTDAVVSLQASFDASMVNAASGAIGSDYSNVMVFTDGAYYVENEDAYRWVGVTNTLEGMGTEYREMVNGWSQSVSRVEGIWSNVLSWVSLLDLNYTIGYEDTMTVGVVFGQSITLDWNKVGKASVLLFRQGLQFCWWSLMLFGCWRLVGVGIGGIEV